MSFPQPLFWIRFIPVKLHIVIPAVFGCIGYSWGIPAWIGFLVGALVGIPLQLLKQRARTVSLQFAVAAKRDERP